MHGGVRISFMHFRFAWLANLGHASWHLKETVARTTVLKSTTGARLIPGSRVCFKQTVEPRLPFLFQNERLSPGSRGDFKENC